MELKNRGFVSLTSSLTKHSDWGCMKWLMEVLVKITWNLKISYRNARCVDKYLCVEYGNCVGRV